MRFVKCLEHARQTRQGEEGSTGCTWRFSLLIVLLLALALGSCNCCQALASGFTFLPGRTPKYRSLENTWASGLVPMRRHGIGSSRLRSTSNALERSLTAARPWARRSSSTCSVRSRPCRTSRNCCLLLDGWSLPNVGCSASSSTFLAMPSHRTTSSRGLCGVAMQFHRHLPTWRPPGFVLLESRCSGCGKGSLSPSPVRLRPPRLIFRSPCGHLSVIVFPSRVGTLQPSSLAFLTLLLAFRALRSRMQALLPFLPSSFGPRRGAEGEHKDV